MTASEINDIYQKLLARGMPECEGLKKVLDQWYLNGTMPVTSKDAEDLITMQAIRHWDVALYPTTDGNHSVSAIADDELMEGRGPSILEAIEAATKEGVTP